MGKYLCKNTIFAIRLKTKNNIYMKKFLLFTIMCLMAFAGKAQIASMTDLLGEYKFTSDMTVTADGEKFFKAGRFAAESDVVIKQDNIYLAAVEGLAGATAGATMGIQQFDASSKKFWTHNANSNSPWVSANIGMTTPDGANPYNGGYTLEFYYDDKGNITIPDFALVQAKNYNSTTATILAQFTNCKLTLLKQEVIVYEDLSGDWTFTSSLSDEESDFATTFDMQIAANNEEFSEYSVDMLFEGYDKVSFNDATFDGQELVINLNDSYLDAENKIALYSYFSPSRQGAIRFKKGSTNSTMSLTSGIRIAQETVIEQKDTIVQLQYYVSGTAIKNVVLEASEFAGTYNVATGKITKVGSIAYPESYDIEIKKDEATGNYLVTKFFGQDIKSMNNGGIPAAVSADDPTKLEISVGNDSRLMDLGNNSYVVLYDPTGSDKNKVTISVNADGTLTMSDFVTRIFDGSKNDISALFQSNSIVRGEEAQPIDFTKAYTIKVDPNSVKVDNPVMEFPAEWEIKFTVYDATNICINSFLGVDVSLINQGGYLIKVDEDDVRTIIVPLSGVKYLKSLVQGEEYLVLCNEEGKNSGELRITIDEQGNATVSDFTVCLMNNETGSNEIVAVYGADNSTAVDSVADEAVISVNNGVVSIAEEAFVEVYNLTGVCVYSGVTTEVSGLNRGIYIVKVGTTVRRIIL